MFGNYLLVKAEEAPCEDMVITVVWSPNWLGWAMGKEPKIEHYRGAKSSWIKLPDCQKVKHSTGVWLGGVWQQKQDQS